MAAVEAGEERVTPDSDADLLVRLRRGDEAVASVVSARYGGELRAFCQRMMFDEALAEDIVQEVLMRVFRVEPGQMPTGSLRGWLYRVARNRCIDALRKMHPHLRLSAVQSGRSYVPGKLAIDPGTTPASQAVKQDRAQRVQAVVDGMEDDLREVVIMHFFQGLSQAEIADALDLSVSGAKARLARATRLLRTRLRALNDAEA